MFTQEEIDTFTKSTFHMTVGIQTDDTENNINLIKKSWLQLSTTTKEYIENFLNREVETHNRITANPEYNNSLMTNLGNEENAQKWVDLLSWMNNN